MKLPSGSPKRKNPADSSPVTVGATQLDPRDRSTCPGRFDLDGRGQLWRNKVQPRYAERTCAVGSHMEYHP